jgi:hypothetical protein
MHLSYGRTDSALPGVKQSREFPCMFQGPGEIKPDEGLVAKAT